MTSLENWAPETLDANSEKSSIALWSTKKHRKCSVVMPESPPAAPRRGGQIPADLVLVQNKPAPPARTTSTRLEVDHDGERVVRKGLSKRSVLLVTWGHCAPSSACLAADNWPMCTSISALAALSIVPLPPTVPSSPAHSLALSLSLIKEVHCP